MPADISDAASREAGPAGARLLSLVLSLLSAAGLAFLLWHLFYRGTAYSFDPMTYARSLWGIARGDFYNPVVFAPVFGIHFQLVQLPLAPLTWLIPPAIVLLLAQAAAFGSTIWLTVRAFARIAEVELGRGSVAAAALFGAFLTLASPLVVNPFLFDARPEMIGIPLIIAGLLRAERRNELDWQSVALLLSSLAAREDFAILVAPALVLIPLRNGISLRSRVALAIGAVAYFAVYLFGIRFVLGGASLVQGFNKLASNMVDPGAESARPYSIPELLRYKSEILLVTAAVMGGFALRSRRWLILLLPGLFFLLAQNRFQPWILNTHYAIFLTPAAVAAGVAGYRRWMREGRPHRYATIGIAIAVTIGIYVLSSAAPAGGRYVAVRFGWRISQPFRTSGLSPVLASMRRMLDEVPPADGLVVPYVFGPPLAGRRVIYAVETIPSATTSAGRVPAGADWVALFPNQWAGYGRMLVEREGFVLHDLIPRSMALLSRRRSGSISATALTEAMPRASCDEPLAKWPEAGVELCGVRSMPGGRIGASIRRQPVSASAKMTPLLALMAAGPQGHTVVPLRMLDGMLPIADLPPDAQGAAVTEQKVLSDSGQLVLLDASSRRIIPAQQRGAQDFVQTVPVTWARR